MDFAFGDAEFGDASFASFSGENSFEVPGDGSFEFGNDSWLQEEGGSQGREKKKKKKSKSKGLEPQGWLSDQQESKAPGDSLATSSGRRVSFSNEPPESRTFPVFADQVANASKSRQDALDSWEDFPHDEVFEAMQAPARQELSSEMEDSAYCRHCGRGANFSAPNTAGSQPNRSTHEVNGFDNYSAGFGAALDDPFDMPKPMERRFSFSLTDMPDAQIRSLGPPHHVMDPYRENLDLQKWNPLNGIKRHWAPSHAEFQQLVGGAATAALSSGTHPASLQMLGSLNEAQKAELRAQDLRKKIAHLESTIGDHRDHSGGHVTITAPLCHDGLGIVLHDLTVTQIIDPIAAQAGWAVGDSILKVNGTTILHSVPAPHGYGSSEPMAHVAAPTVVMGNNYWTGPKLVENICQRLSEEWQQPPLIALLLPSTAGGSAWQALESLSEKVVIEGFAETTYCGADVCLWVLRWACENTRTDPPAITLEIFASYVTAAMAKFHPRDSGPFLWPLHDKDIASAIAMCEYVGGDAPWWRKVLWGLRIVQPPGGTVLEECILDHYGREVGYVFAWANLFTRSLWVLTILCLFFYICGARAQLGGFQGVLPGAYIE
ncbi:PDZ domain-containing protein [Durusdinium trenchii]|uniref:PDZ domain-containing protein n=1 Tax=Durusdinium trenchii TaxID=1381693 RepID=A0ABP0M137_9DINO